MDGLTVYKISKILKQNIINYSIKTIGVVSNNVQIVFYKHPRYSCLHILLNPQLVAIYVNNSAYSIDNRFKFLNNTRIKDVDSSDFERIIFIDLFKYRSSGRKIMYKLVFEFFTKYPNFYILDEENKIIYMLNNYYLDKSRKMTQGEYYIDVRSNKSKSLISDNFYDFRDMKGFYSVTTRHALELANNIGFDKAKQSIINSLNSNCFYIDVNDRLIPFEPLDYKKVITFEELENYYKEKVNNGLLHSQKRRLLNYFDRQEKKLKNAYQKVQNELDDANKYYDYIKRAELLKNNIHILKNEKGKVFVNEYTEDGAKKILVDIPDKDLLSEINRLFKRGKKLKRAKPYLETRLDSIGSSLKELKEDISSVEACDNLSELNFYYEYYLKTTKQPNENKNINSLFYRFRKNNVLYLVGKNKRANRTLLINYSNKDDMWFHAKGMPSAHVIAKKNGVLSEDEIIFGARLAASFSKLRNEKKVEIDYTLRKYLRKTKNTDDGLFFYDNYKTIVVEPFSNIL